MYLSCRGQALHNICFLTTSVYISTVLYKNEYIHSQCNCKCKYVWPMAIIAMKTALPE